MYFEQIIVHFGKIGCFSIENGILMGGYSGNEIGESQIFEVQPAHSHTILAEVTPPQGSTQMDKS